ncbi:hypothetical protein D9611_014396 [Ephemerocybe angulata]|uniref:CHAT domain-containing protein n=1 Tax=Ephemerocybe angulata TaxID=980116 RepID=A0A8H5AR02_9AGAR|nr:hypothetical protein D9611_014396 [Tulosesus angulatus]
MVDLDQSLQRRYTQIREVSAMAPESAAFALSVGRADKALEWLEQGRCLVWSQLNHLRTPLDDLRVRDASLAQRIADVSKQLEQGVAASPRASAQGTSLPDRILVEDGKRERLKLAKEWEDLLRTVRDIPGFKAFLKPSPCSDILSNLPEGGTVIVINIDGVRADALALMAGLDEPLHIPLPNLTLEKAFMYRSRLTAQLQLQGMRERELETLDRSMRPVPNRNRKRSRLDEESVRGVLYDLWVEVVKPILDMLALPKRDSSSKGMLPRIWWCPTGPLSLLPIHAAGIYDEQGSHCVMDYAVSSYTPTVTSLTDRVKNHRRINQGVVGLFLTSQPKVPGAAEIPGTSREVEAAYSRARQNRARALKLVGDDVTVEECLDHLEVYSNVHLACHASQNVAEPLESRFLFHDGSMTLGMIIQRNLKNADLAFLSACQTSTGDEQLSNESVHLAAGMLAAGYRRVVATMWSIGDQHATDVSSDFYEYLWRRADVDDRFDGSWSAYALHEAIQKLRNRLDNSENSLLAWVPFVHFGY